MRAILQKVRERVWGIERRGERGILYEDWGEKTKRETSREEGRTSRRLPS
jgi:hypothetical protein